MTLKIPRDLREKTVVCSQTNEVKARIISTSFVTFRKNLILSNLRKIVYERLLRGWYSEVTMETDLQAMGQGRKG